MRKTVLLLLTAGLVAVGSADAATQAFWKWRDASGQIHLSDTAPPADTPDRNILQRPNGHPQPVEAAAPVQMAAASGVDTELQKKKAAAAKAKAEQVAADKTALEQKNTAIKSDNCQRAQVQAQALQSGARVARLDANGERTYLDDSQRAAELQRTQDIVTQNCAK